MKPIRVVIADDHAVLRAGLRLLLAAQHDIAVIGEAADGADAIRKARELRPDVLLLDLSMPGPSSGTVIGGILRASPKSRVVVLTMHDDTPYLRSALAAGATGYLVKKAADAELMSAIRAVHAGRTFVDLTLSPGRARRERGPSSARPPKRLSRREAEVLRLLAQGHSNQQIAGDIGVSVKTVETYRTRLRDKLGLKGRAQLFRFAVEAGLLDADLNAARDRAR